MNEKIDTVHVVGGGVMGLLCARELATAGLAVELFDQGPVGRESSWAGGGILSPLCPWRYPAAVNQLSARSQSVYPELAEQLREATGIDCELLDSGLLILGLGDRQIATARQWGAAQKVPGSDPVRELATADCIDIEPAAADSGGNAIWMAQVRQIRNPRLIQALRADALARDVRLHEGVRVHGLGIDKARIRTLHTDADRIEVDRCLVTAGAWSRSLLAETGLDLPIEPVRGQMLRLRSRPETLRRIVLRDGHYVIPRRDGQILVGSTVELAGFDKTTTAEARQTLLNAARSLVPALAQAPVAAQWAGLRPGSPDDVPYIGPHPEVQGLFVCAGHYRNGLVLAPASARLVVDMMLERVPQVDPAAYRLDRSGPRQIIVE